MKAKCPQSICITCNHNSFCVLTSKKELIHSCSEYLHYKDNAEQPLEAYFSTVLVPEQ